MVEGFVGGIMLPIMDSLAGHYVGSTYLKNQENDIYELFYYVWMAGWFYAPPKIGESEERTETDAIDWDSNTESEESTWVDTYRFNFNQ